MDKYEFNIKVEQIKKLVNRGDYETAMKIADTIDWHRVRNASLLSMIAQIYEKNKEYQEAKDILLLAYRERPLESGFFTSWRIWLSGREAFPRQRPTTGSFVILLRRIRVSICFAI